MGIEPTSEAWEASILPLYDARLTVRRYYTQPSFDPYRLATQLEPQSRIGEYASGPPRAIAAIARLPRT
jgi:hypothetical protein